MFSDRIRPSSTQVRRYTRTEPNALVELRSMADTRSVDYNFKSCPGSDVVSRKHSFTASLREVNSSLLEVISFLNWTYLLHFGACNEEQRDKMSDMFSMTIEEICFSLVTGSVNSKLVSFFPCYRNPLTRVKVGFENVIDLRITSSKYQ